MIGRSCAPSFALALVAAVAPAVATGAEPVTRVWLTHRSADPSEVVVNYMTAEPEPSVVRYGLVGGELREVRLPGSRTLHHVAVPLDARDAVYRYSVGERESASAEATYKASPTDVLRVAVVANWHRRPDLSALLADDPHLLLTAGDNVPDLHGRCGAGDAGCVAPYADLIDAYPALFRSTPFLPVLGNHDREVRPRGPKPPAEPVYDIEARAFRDFFELPGDEWKWRFDVPSFGVRFVAVDLNHVGDRGTTWQSCHDFTEGSEQLLWYEGQTAGERPPFLVTLSNEKHSTVRGLAGGRWGRLLPANTVCVSGFGHFAERAELDGVGYYNTSLAGKGAKYPDPHSRFLASEDGYLLLTFDRSAGTMAAVLKSLDGRTLDRTVYATKRPDGRTATDETE